MGLGLLLGWRLDHALAREPLDEIGVHVDARAGWIIDAGVAVGALERHRHGLLGGGLFVGQLGSPFKTMREW